MNTTVYARIVHAEDAGATVDRSRISPASFPASVSLFTGMDFGVDRCLPEPFEKIVVMPEVAAYRGQIIGVVTGQDWRTLDGIAATIPQTIATPIVSENGEDADRYNTALDFDTSETEEIVEGIYQTGLQLHVPDAPLWAEAVPSGKGVVVTAPCQWPAHIRASVAQILDVPIRSVHLNCRPPSGNRDGAITIPAILTSLCAFLSVQLDAPVRIALRNDQSFLSGGRAPGRVVWSSRLAEDGTLLSNGITVAVNLGAYATFEKEMAARMRIAASSVYRPVPTDYRLEFKRTADIPMAAFEGVGSAQLSFAREVHYNRLAEVAGHDPILWRKEHIRRDWPVVDDIFTTLAREADFHPSIQRQ